MSKSQDETAIVCCVCHIILQRLTIRATYSYAYIIHVITFSNTFITQLVKLIVFSAMQTPLVVLTTPWYVMAWTIVRMAEMKHSVAVRE